MPLSTVELTQARQAVAALLEQLGLEAYLFEVEPRDGQWEIRLECAVQDGWQALAWPVEKTALLASGQDAALRETLLRDWRHRLASCKIGGKVRKNGAAP